MKKQFKLFFDTCETSRFSKEFCELILEIPSNRYFIVREKTVYDYNKKDKDLYLIERIEYKERIGLIVAGGRYSNPFYSYDTSNKEIKVIDISLMKEDNFLIIIDVSEVSEEKFNLEERYKVEKQSQKSYLIDKK